MAKNNFTNGKPRICTEEEFNAKWGGKPNNLYCSLCGGAIQVGDTWRFQYMSKMTFVENGKTKVIPNLILCEKCDDSPEELRDRWIGLYNEFNSPKFRWYRNDIQISHIM